MTRPIPPERFREVLLSEMVDRPGPLPDFCVSVYLPDESASATTDSTLRRDLWRPQKTTLRPVLVMAGVGMCSVSNLTGEDHDLRWRDLRPAVA